MGLNICRTQVVCILAPIGTTQYVYITSKEVERETPLFSGKCVVFTPITTDHTPHFLRASESHNYIYFSNFVYSW